MNNKQPHPQTRRSRILIPFCGLVLIIAAGIADGVITNRWDRSGSLQQVSKLLSDLPKKIGEWESIELEIPPQQLVIAGATGSVARQYTHTKTGASIQVTLLCGPHGPISLHPPTVCFTGAGWTQKTPEQKQEFQKTEDSQHTFWECRFTRENDLREQVILTDWAWSDGSGWVASDNPRFEYASSPFLIKLYITSEASLADGEARAQRDQFVNLLLDEIERTITDPIAAITNN